MTTDNMETEIEKLSNIMVEMRRFLASFDTAIGGRTITRANEVSRDEMDRFADRIEAAARREELRWAKANGELARMLDPEKVQGGNAPKLREVLEGIKKFVEGQCKIANDDARAILDNIETALTAPPRNCDRFDDEQDAQIAFLNEVWLISVSKETMIETDKFDNWTNEMKKRFVSWLFAKNVEEEN